LKVLTLVKGDLVYNPLVTLYKGFRSATDVRRSSGIRRRDQVVQLLALRRASGMSRVEYYKYKLWRPDLSTVDKLSYTSLKERKGTVSVANRLPGPKRERSKSEDVESLAGTGVAVPELLGMVSVAGTEHGIRSAEALGQFLARLGSAGLVFKREVGSQGDSVIVSVSADADGVMLTTGELMGTDRLWATMAQSGNVDWRIERWLRPHPVMANWARYTTPTLRLLTLHLGDRVAVHAASAKIPMHDSGVDNLARGNLAASVDIATGVVGRAVNGTNSLDVDRHPVTGADIKGVQVPHWQAAREAVARCADRLLPRRILGWDVAITDSGPVVIEVNASPCEKLLQLPAQRGLVHGAYIQMLHQVGLGSLLAARRESSPAWRMEEEAALAGSPLPSPDRNYSSSL